MGIEVKKINYKKMKKTGLVIIALALILAMGAGEVKKKKIWAKSVLHEKAPELVVEEWITAKPDTKGKFVLIDFWATTCGPCRKVIPEMNEWSERFKDELVIIGISHEKAERVKAMTDPSIAYYSGVDTRKTMYERLEVKGIPHVILIDPNGVVRWEGFPLSSEDRLTTGVIEDIIKKYKK